MKYTVKHLVFSQDSLGDPFGRLFFLNGHVYRLIQKEFVKSCHELLDSELFILLESKSYVPKSWITDDIEVDGFDLVLEHERLFDTKPHEWSFQMYKDAACFLLELNSLCNQFGFELKDAHPHNVLFKDGHPIMVDIGSFQKKSSITWTAKNEFIHTFYLPLLMWSRGEMFFERLVVESDNYPYRVSPYQSPEQNEYVKQLLRPIRLYKICFGREYTTRFLFVYALATSLSKILNKVFPKFSRFIKTSYYYKDISLPDIEKLQPSTQIPIVFEESIPKGVGDLFSSLSLDEVSFMDVECGHGEFINLIESNSCCKRIIAVDSRSDCIDFVYQKYSRTSPVFPVLSSIINPPDLDSFISRFHSAVVICHGCIESYLNKGFLLSTICERLDSLADKYLFVLIDKRRYPINEEMIRLVFEPFFKTRCVESMDSNVFVYIGSKA